MAVYIDHSRCMKCGVCVTSCPHEALSLAQEGGRIIIAVDEERCIDCGICAEQCPVQVMHLPEGAGASQDAGRPAAPARGFSGPEVSPGGHRAHAEPEAQDGPSPLPTDVGSDSEADDDEWDIRHWRPGKGQLRGKIRERLRRGGRAAK